MKTILLPCLCLLTHVWCTSGADPDVPNVPTPSAAELLQTAVAILPREPLELKGTLTVRRQRGQVLGEHRFVMQLDWGNPTPHAIYEVQDTFGRTLERLTVTRTEGQAKLALEQGDPLVPAAAPSLAARVGGSDVTWLDLTLDFLWWPAARLEGQARLKGRDCDVVVVSPPEPIPGCSAVRLWLDRQAGFLLQAEQLDPQGAPSRRMWVRSIKEIRERWIIRDMDIETLKSDHRTRLHVEDWVAR